MENLLKEKLTRGAQPIGTFLELGSADVVEALAQTGFDFVIIDNEHGPFEAESTAHFVRAALLHNFCPLARVREISRPAVLKLLDSGAQGIIAPDISNVAEVKKLIEYAKYPPIGKRGFGPSRKDTWGFASPARSVAESMAHFNQETLLLPQCETAGALECIEEIVALDGVDGIFIGPFDLSISMGIPGQFDHPDFIAALARIKSACNAAGKICMYFCVNEETAKSALAQGYDAITYSMDSSILIQSCRNLLSNLRQGS